MSSSFWPFFIMFSNWQTGHPTILAQFTVRSQVENHWQCGFSSLQGGIKIRYRGSLVNTVSISAVPGLVRFFRILICQTNENWKIFHQYILVKTSINMAKISWAINNNFERKFLSKSVPWNGICPASVLVLDQSPISAVSICPKIKWILFCPVKMFKNLSF